MAPFNRIICASVAVVEFVVVEVGFEVDVSWHAPVLQLHAATPYYPLAACPAERLEHATGCAGALARRPPYAGSSPARHLNNSTSVLRRQGVGPLTLCLKAGALWPQIG